MLSNLMVIFAADGEEMRYLGLVTACNSAGKLAHCEVRHNGHMNMEKHPKTLKVLILERCPTFCAVFSIVFLYF